MLTNEDIKAEIFNTIESLMDENVHLFCEKNAAILFKLTVSSLSLKALQSIDIRELPDLYLKVCEDYLQQLNEAA